MQRNQNIDIIKGWAMLTIIVFHCSSSFFSSLNGHFLGNPWNVPVFFIIGGFFLKLESLEKPFLFLKGKFQRLYLPATIIYGLMLLLHNLFVHINWYPLGKVHPATGAPFTLYDIKDTAVGLIKVVAAGGSGELIMGAMWFLYALLYAFVALTIIYTLISFVIKEDEKRFQWTTIILFLIAAVSCILSQNYGITFSRFSSASSAMFLIWWGMIINKRWQWKYDQWWAFILSILIFVHCVLMHKGRMVLAYNQFQDMAMLIVGCTAIIYVWGFIGKKIENSFLGKFLALMGRESLYLMAFHITGFFICNSLMEELGIFSLSDEKGLYTYKLYDNGFLLMVYVIFGIATSLLIVYSFRFVKNLICKSMLSFK